MNKYTFIQRRIDCFQPHRLQFTSPQHFIYVYVHHVNSIPEPVFIELALESTISENDVRVQEILFYIIACLLDGDEDTHRCTLLEAQVVCNSVNARHSCGAGVTIATESYGINFSRSQQNSQSSLTTFGSKIRTKLCDCKTQLHIPKTLYLIYKRNFF